MAPDKDLSSGMSSLSVSKKPTKKKAEVADSWEDEESGSESEPESNDAGTKTPTTTVPTAPPPTPMSPSYGPGSDWDNRATSNASPPAKDKRPEKTDAVARRLIAAGLGLKAPKQTEEQKAYQKSVREQEKKRREQEREAERQKQDAKDKAKAAMWDD